MCIVNHFIYPKWAVLILQQSKKGLCFATATFFNNGGLHSVLAHEECGNQSGTGVGADDNADVGDEIILEANLLYKCLGVLFCALGAVGMADVDGLASGIDNTSLDGLDHAIKGGLIAAHLVAHLEMPLCVEVKNGIDSQQTAEEGADLAHTAASLEVGKVGSGVVGVAAALVSIKPCGNLVDGLACVAHIGSIDTHGAVAKGCRGGVYHHDL